LRVGRKREVWRALSLACPPCLGEGGSLGARHAQITNANTQTPKNREIRIW
jgi:hypothetical protein